MIDGIESYYQRIANSITECIPEEWSVATLHAMFYEDGSTYEAEYARQKDGKAIGLATSSDGSRAIRDMRKAFRLAGQPVWGQLLFVLRADGTFNCKWSYEGCDANGDLPFDEEEKIRRHDNRRHRFNAGESRSHDLPMPPV
jgi:hypothetical protein